MALTNLINADKVSKMNKKPVGLKTIDIDDIEVNQHNQFDINGIDELKSSILEYGLRKPLDVYDRPDTRPEYAAGTGSSAGTGSAPAPAY